MSEEKYMQLYEFIWVCSDITCSECGKTKYKHSDEIQASEEFYADGWRKIKEGVYCPDCVNTKKKNK